ncbi:MAG TPA: plastocyanin/azurin family copper-binding protein [Solirubrobacterales bacterium]|jgi:plastocyanin|nr:plastocyanin/azurin family copper-binding protein [Solirubrobacterales bacterium]
MKKVGIALVLVIAAIALVACGGGSSTTSGGETSETGSAAENGGGSEGGEGKSGGGGSVKFEADPNGGIEYTTTSATAKAGQVTVEFSNPQPLTHDVAIEDSNGEVVGKTELISEGSDSASVNLKPGTYTFFCSVPGHRQAGMEGTLTVK